LILQQTREKVWEHVLPPPEIFGKLKGKLKFEIFGKLFRKYKIV
jgi:hypothetical protein